MLIEPRTAFVVAAPRPLSAKEVGMWIEPGLFRRSKSQTRIPLVRARLPSFGYSLPWSEITFPKETNPMLAYDGLYLRLHPTGEYSILCTNEREGSALCPRWTWGGALHKPCSEAKLHSLTGEVVRVVKVPLTKI